MKTESSVGAVCYIDLLGFSYLTQLLEVDDVLKDDSEKSFEDKTVKELTLDDLRKINASLFRDNVISNNKDIKISDWAYDILDNNLRNFHEIIDVQCKKYSSTKISVISDSVFIVNESSDNLLFILANIFRDCLKAGILLRAGLSYGPYYTVKSSIGNYNFFGSTVTKAVNYEKSGKGCRIFTDPDFPCTCEIFKINSEIFFPYKNYQNYAVIDCFEWFLIKDDYVFRAKDLRMLTGIISFPNKDDILNLINDNIEIFYKIWYFEKFEWNSKTENGLIHLGATFDYLLDLNNKIFNVSEEFKIFKMESDQSGFEFVKTAVRNNKRMNELIKEFQIDNEWIRKVQGHTFSCE